MRQFIADNYNSGMNANFNPLLHIPNKNTRHAVTLSLLFGLGPHFFLVHLCFYTHYYFFDVLVTLGTFEAAKRHEIHLAVSEQPAPSM